ncbi:MAG: hypothetical protein IPM31_13745 [Anaerolineae bacterium]|nr:hypothetical protein [Anaerolineae bacterium]
MDGRRGARERSIRAEAAEPEDPAEIAGAEGIGVAVIAAAEGRTWMIRRLED